MAPVNMFDLSPSQRGVLRYFEERAAAGLPPPTLRDICERFGWASTAAARDHVRRLKAKGLLRAGADGAARATTLALPPAAFRHPDRIDRDHPWTFPLPAGYVPERPGTWTFVCKSARHRHHGILRGDTVIVGPVTELTAPTLYVVQAKRGFSIRTALGPKTTAVGLVIASGRSFLERPHGA